MSIGSKVRKELVEHLNEAIHTATSICNRVGAHSGRFFCSTNVDGLSEMWFDPKDEQNSPYPVIEASEIFDKQNEKYGLSIHTLRGLYKEVEGKYINGVFVWNDADLVRSCARIDDFFDAVVCKLERILPSGSDVLGTFYNNTVEARTRSMMSTIARH